MHNFLDDSFNIYSLNLVRAGNKVKYPRLAIFFALLVFWEVAARSSSGMSRFFFLILVSCWCNGLDQSYMENGFLCLLALALRFRVSACMYVTLSHYRGEFRVWHFFCFLHCSVYMHKNPAYERMKLSLSLCLWTPNATTACWSDQPRDQPGKYLYYAGTFWLYLQSHCRLRNVTLVCVLCAYNGHLTMALVWPRWRKKKSGPPCAW